MDKRLLKLQLRGASCKNCRFLLEHRKYSGNLDWWHRKYIESLDWCYSHEKQPLQNVCMLWEEPTLEDEFTKVTKQLLEQRKQKTINVKVKKPTKAQIKEWYDWSILDKADH